MLFTTCVHKQKPRVKVSNDKTGTYITVEFGEQFSITALYTEWSELNRKIVEEVGIMLDNQKS